MTRKYLSLIDTPDFAQAQRLADFMRGETFSCDFDEAKMDPDVFMGIAFHELMNTAVYMADILDGLCKPKSIRGGQ